MTDEEITDRINRLDKRIRQTLVGEKMEVIEIALASTVASMLMCMTDAYRSLGGADLFFARVNLILSQRGDVNAANKFNHISTQGPIQ